MTAEAHSAEENDQQLPTTHQQPGPSPSPAQQQQQSMPKATRRSRTEENDKQTEEGDEAHMMQRTQLDDSVASSSHGGPMFRRPQPQRMPNSEAMVRHWLRELAALLQQRRVGDNIPLLLEQASQAVGQSRGDPETCENGTIAEGPVKKRRIMSSLSVARMRLQDLTEEDDMDGLNQHQIRQDLEQAAYDLAVWDKLLQYATLNQWGHQVQQGFQGLAQAQFQGLAQAQAAVQTALAATVEGDLDWHVPGWGQAVVMLLEDAEAVLEEEGQLDFVHPADVAALSEGAEEAPPLRQGDLLQQIDKLLGYRRGHELRTQRT